MAISEREQRYDEFFRTPLDTLHVEHWLADVERGDGGRWYGFSSDLRGILFRIAFVRGKNPAVRLVIDRDDADWNRWLFDTLSQRRQSIESDISATLDWDYVGGRRRCIISDVRHGDIDDPQDTWPEMQSWMIERLLAFKRVFGPHLRELAK
jgi:hypothetical protein